VCLMPRSSLTALYNFGNPSIVSKVFLCRPARRSGSEYKEMLSIVVSFGKTNDASQLGIQIGWLGGRNSLKFGRPMSGSDVVQPIGARNFTCFPMNFVLYHSNSVSR